MTLTQEIIEQIGVLDYSLESGKINDPKEFEVEFEGKTYEVFFTVKGFKEYSESQRDHYSPTDYTLTKAGFYIEDLAVYCEEKEVLNANEKRYLENEIIIYYGE